MAQPWPDPFSQENTGTLCGGCCLCPLWELIETQKWGEKAASAFGGAARQYLLGEELQAAGSSAR